VNGLARFREELPAHISDLGAQATAHHDFL
jgi:hypothetical protein